MDINVPIVIWTAKLAFFCILVKDAVLLLL